MGNASGERPCLSRGGSSRCLCRSLGKALLFEQLTLDQPQLQARNSQIPRGSCYYKVIVASAMNVAELHDTNS